MKQACLVSTVYDWRNLSSFIHILGIVRNLSPFLQRIPCKCSINNPKYGKSIILRWVKEQWDNSGLKWSSYKIMCLLLYYMLFSADHIVDMDGCFGIDWWWNYLTGGNVTIYYRVQKIKYSYILCHACCMNSNKMKPMIWQENSKKAISHLTNIIELCVVLARHP